VAFGISISPNDLVKNPGPEKESTQRDEGSMNSSASQKYVQRLKRSAGATRFLELEPGLRQPIEPNSPQHYPR
jgi:hypothetical protein